MWLVENTITKSGESFLGFPCSSAGKETIYNAEDLSSIPKLGRSSGEGKGYPIHYSGLEKSMDCIFLVGKSQTWLSDFHVTSLSFPFFSEWPRDMLTGYLRTWCDFTEHSNRFARSYVLTLWSSMLVLVIKILDIRYLNKSQMNFLWFKLWVCSVICQKRIWCW